MGGDEGHHSSYYPCHGKMFVEVFSNFNSRRYANSLGKVLTRPID